MKFSKESIKIFLVFILSVVLFSGCTLSNNEINQSSQIINDDKEVLEMEEFPDYLKLENDELYCEYGDQENPNPKTGVEYSKQKMEEVEFPGSLVIINYQYAKDKANIYSYGHTCTDGMPGSCSCYFDKLNIDVNSFQLLDEDHIKDKNIVIVSGEEINNVDVKSFELITAKDGAKTQYGKDKNNIYHYGEIIKEADYSSFEAINTTEAKDKNNFYKYGVLQNK